MIFVTGDCHGRYERFDSGHFTGQEEMDRQDYVIVCGDFGYWDRSSEQEYWLNWLEQKDFTLLFVDGNHENFEMLEELPMKEWNGGNVQFIRENVIRLMRGQMYQLQGKRFFTFGGAKSHDIQDGILKREDPNLREKVLRLEEAGARYRIEHLSWWKEEMPSSEEMDAGFACLARHGWKCDYIITHCAPTSLQAAFSLGTYHPDFLTDYLEEIRERCQYREWYFGHYHQNLRVDEKHQMLYEEIRRIV